MDIRNLPSCPFEARALLITEHAADRARLAVDYIKNRYPQAGVFQESGDFVYHDLLDCMRSDFGGWRIRSALWNVCEFKLWSQRDLFFRSHCSR
jgi:hypothetical protein